MLDSQGILHRDRADMNGVKAELAARTLVLPVRLMIEEEDAFRQMVLKVVKR